MKSNPTFEQIFHAYYSPLCNYAAKILNDDDLAEEVVQDLFVQLLEKGTLDTVEHLDRFLLRSTKFKCIDFLRKHQKAQLISYEQKPEEEPADDELASEEQIDALFHYFVAKLPIKTREVFLLIRKSGLTYKEAAEELDISVKTIENQMSRALRKMRDILKDYGYLSSLITLF
jgi:RNA polymerase sigma-70 factor (ECF subfamily)